MPESRIREGAGRMAGRSMPLNGGNMQAPYPGLRPFEESEALLFFGQDAQIDDLRTRLYEERFVAILGLSGCGKSSLLKAGLLADIRPKKVKGPRPRWLIGSMKPGADPLEMLTGVVAGIDREIAGQKLRLEETDGKREPFDRSNFLADAFGLARFGRNAGIYEEQRILIVVDQFEELFRYQREAPRSSEKDRAALFVRLLLEAVKDEASGISIIITMRSEFLGDCALFRGLAEQVNQATFLLPRMSRAEMEEVITGPAEDAGFGFDPAVVQQLLNEAEQQDDGLPLLQHALRRIWENWRRRGAEGAISVADLNKFENPPAKDALLIKHHLDDHLDSIYNSLNRPQQIVAEMLFRLLSERDSRGRLTRRPVLFSGTRSEDAAAKEWTPTVVESIGQDRVEDVKTVIEAFRDDSQGRTFLTPGHPDPFEKEVIDISHECLLRRWDRLRAWIDREQHDAELYWELAEDADVADWDQLKLGRKPTPLAGTKLEWLQDWWSKTEIVGAPWALRYQGEIQEGLDRPKRTFAGAKRFLEWSGKEAVEAETRRKNDEEERIRSAERVQYYHAKAAHEKREKRMWLLAAGVLFCLLGLLSWSLGRMCKGG